jgi:hypothetical protein
MSCLQPCDGCVFTNGTAANLEPYNALKAVLCSLGGVPFYCHHNVKWRQPEAHRKRSRSEIRKMDVCAGWKREISELAATGYFKSHRLIKRAHAELGLGALETFAGKLSKRRKAMAKKTLHGVIHALVKERDRPPMDTE